MRVCVCVYVRACACVCACMHIYIWLYLCINLFVREYTTLFTNPRHQHSRRSQYPWLNPTPAYLCVYLHVYFVCVCVRVRVCTYSWIYTCINLFVRMYTMMLTNPWHQHSRRSQYPWLNPTPTYWSVCLCVYLAQPMCVCVRVCVFLCEFVYK